MSLSNFILDLEPLVNSRGSIQDDGNYPGEYLSPGDRVVVGVDDSGKPLVAIHKRHGATELPEDIDMVVEGEYDIIGVAPDGGETVEQHVLRNIVKR